MESPVPVEVGTLAVRAGVDPTVLPPKTVLKRTIVVIIISNMDEMQMSDLTLFLEYS